MKDEMKHFADWIELKEKLHSRKRLRTFHEWEIWWCAVGENVGVEINGKGKIFARPVLVFKKFNSSSLMSIPLTSQPHSGSWYVDFRFQGKDEVAVLSQMRMVCVSRLYNKMGSIDDSDKMRICEAFLRLYLPEKILPSLLK